MDEIILEWDRTIRIQGNTLYISLPNDWIRGNKIRPGKNVKLKLLSNGILQIVKEKSHE